MEELEGEHSRGTKEKEQGEEAVEEGSWGFLPLRQEGEAGRERKKGQRSSPHKPTHHLVLD